MPFEIIWHPVIENRHLKVDTIWRILGSNAQDKIIMRLGDPSDIRLADKNMSISGLVYMQAGIASSRLAANHCPRNGIDHLHIVERPDVHIIFTSSCSSHICLDTLFDSYEQHSSASTIYNGTSTHYTLDRDQVYKWFGRF